MKHIAPISRAPQEAQVDNSALSAVFTLIANVLFAVSSAVLAKENSQFPDISIPTTTA